MLTAKALYILRVQCTFSWSMSNWCWDIRVLQSNLVHSLNVKSYFRPSRVRPITLTGSFKEPSAVSALFVTTLLTHGPCQWQIMTNMMDLSLFEVFVRFHLKTRNMCTHRLSVPELLTTIMLNFTKKRSNLLKDSTTSLFIVVECLWRLCDGNLTTDTLYNNGAYHTKCLCYLL